jgi:hypothetical protein
MQALDVRQGRVRHERAQATALQFLTSLFAGAVHDASLIADEAFEWFGTRGVDWDSPVLRRFIGEERTTPSNPRVIETAIVLALPEPVLGAILESDSIVLVDLTRRGRCSTVAVVMSSAGRIRRVVDAMPLREGVLALGDGDSPGLSLASSRQQGRAAHATRLRLSR